MRINEEGAGRNIYFDVAELKGEKVIFDLAKGFPNKILILKEPGMLVGSGVKKTFCR